MTEAEAKTKWCPFARVMFCDARGEAVKGLPASNRMQADGEGGCNVPFASMCVASACMAWRVNRDAGKAGTGFCGLAGRSE